MTVTNWYESLSFGIRELDAAVSADDFYAVTLAKDEWFSSTCSCYGIQASINYEEEKERNVCWSAGASNTQGGEISGPVKGAEGERATSFLNIYLCYFRLFADVSVSRTQNDMYV